jgi:hypothetical protein
MTVTVNSVKTKASASSGKASRQLMRTAAGSKTATNTKAEKCSRKNDTQSHHKVSVPVSMILSCRPECVPAW